MKSYHQCKLQNHWANEWHGKQERLREMENLSTDHLQNLLMAFWATDLLSTRYFLLELILTLSHHSSLLNQIFRRAT